MKKKRVCAENLQFKNYVFIDEEYENTDDIADLYEEYGTRLKDGTVNGDDHGDEDECAGRGVIKHYTGRNDDA